MATPWYWNLTRKFDSLNIQKQKNGQIWPDSFAFFGIPGKHFGKYHFFRQLENAGFGGKNSWKLPWQRLFSKQPFPGWVARAKIARQRRQKRRQNWLMLHGISCIDLRLLTANQHKKSWSITPWKLKLLLQYFQLFTTVDGQNPAPPGMVKTL